MEATENEGDTAADADDAAADDDDDDDDDDDGANPPPSDIWIIPCSLAPDLTTGEL